MENKPTFAILTTQEYNTSKETGTWPVANIVAVRSDWTNAQGNRPVYFMEVVTSADAQWVVKSTKGKEGEALDREVEDIKHACWAAVEILHQHTLTVMEPGCHVFGFDTGRPEATAGAVAAWCRNPQFVKFAPAEGWSEVIWRNGHYIGGAELSYGATTKHDYEDMLLTGAANFHIGIPPFLGNWAEAVVEALQATAENSVKASKTKLTTWNINQQVRTAVVNQLAHDSVPEVASVNFMMIDGTSRSLADVAPATVLYFNRRVDGDLVPQGYVTWDGSKDRTLRIGEYVRRGFVVSDKAL